MRIVFKLETRMGDKYLLGTIIKQGKKSVKVAADNGKEYVIDSDEILGSTLAGRRQLPFKDREQALRYVDMTKPTHIVPNVVQETWQIGDRIMCIHDGIRLGSVEKISTSTITVLFDNGVLANIPSIGTHILGRATYKKAPGKVKNMNKYLVKADVDLTPIIPDEPELTIPYAPTFWLGQDFLAKDKVQCQTDRGPIWVYSIYDIGQLTDDPTEYQDAFIGTIGLRERQAEIVAIVSISIQPEKLEEYGHKLLAILRGYKNPQPISIPHLLIEPIKAQGGRLVDEFGGPIPLGQPTDLRQAFFTYAPAPEPIPEPPVPEENPEEEEVPAKGKGKGKKAVTKVDIKKVALPTLPTAPEPTQVG